MEIINFPWNGDCPELVRAPDPHFSINFAKMRLNFFYNQGSKWISSKKSEDHVTLSSHRGACMFAMTNIYINLNKHASQVWCLHHHHWKFCHKCINICRHMAFYIQMSTPFIAIMHPITMATLCINGLPQKNVQPPSSKLLRTASITRSWHLVLLFGH